MTSRKTRGVFLGLGVIFLFGLQSTFGFAEHMAKEADIPFRDIVINFKEVTNEKSGQRESFRIQPKTKEGKILGHGISAAMGAGTVSLEIAEPQPLFPFFFAKRTFGVMTVYYVIMDNGATATLCGDRIFYDAETQNFVISDLSQGGHSWKIYDSKKMKVNLDGSRAGVLFGKIEKANYIPIFHEGKYYFVSEATDRVKIVGLDPEDVTLKTVMSRPDYEKLSMRKLVDVTSGLNWMAVKDKYL